MRIDKSLNMSVRMPVLAASDHSNLVLRQLRALTENKIAQDRFPFIQGIS